MVDPSVYELRRYTLYPGRRDELIELFEEHFIEPQEEAGAQLIGLFRDAQRPDRFVWIRAFADMAARKKALEAFYGGDVWKAHRNAANATMIDSDNVMLLRPVKRMASRGTQAREPITCVTYLLHDKQRLREFARNFEAEQKQRGNGARVLATFATEYTANNFPQLPVREGEHAFVALIDGALSSDLANEEPADIEELVPTARSRVHF